MAATVSATMEDYLEAIYRLQREGEQVRVKGVAEALSVALPTVTSALQTLKSAELVRHEKYGTVELTLEGLRRAEEINRRHGAFVDFLTSVLQVDPKTAEDEACAMEHAISPRTLTRLITLMEFLKVCPRTGEEWLGHLAGRWDDFPCDGECADCIAAIEAPEKEGRRAGRGQTLVLSECAPGCRGLVVDIGGSGPTRRRIADMGVTRGVPVEVARVAPLGDPMEVKVRGYHLSLRKSEASRIKIEVMQEPPGQRGPRRRRARRRGG